MSSLGGNIRIGLILAGGLLGALAALPALRADHSRAASVERAESLPPDGAAASRADLFKLRAAAADEFATQAAATVAAGGAVSAQAKNGPIIVTCPDFIRIGVCSALPDFDPPMQAHTTWWKTTVGDVARNGHKQQQVICWYGGADAPSLLMRTLPQGYKCEDVNAKDTVCKNVGIKIGK